jgi:hypothetical protein
MHAARYVLKRESIAPNSERTGNINESEFKVFSQNGEDGILERIFKEIGFSSRRFVEFGFSPVECNALRLVRRHGFSGVWIDADRDNCEVAKMMAKILRWKRVQVVNSFITKANINALLLDTRDGANGDLDLLSIDIDGVDLWILQTIRAVRARVLVCEYNDIFGNDQAITVPYHDSFERFSFHPDGIYFGASLKAFEIVAGMLGYRLIGCDKSGSNAFFLANEIDAPNLPTMSSDECWMPMRYWGETIEEMASKFECVANLPFVSVESSKLPLSIQ